GAADLIGVSGALLDRLAELLETPARAGGRLVLSAEEGAEARALLPRLLASRLGREPKALGFLDALATAGPAPGPG
ncbi:MAG TPA: hypothetical protein VNM66_08430, partial [Thermodesulfobacteriota bacterium]|nr:hypothetical protein [Thermodesulfobacteriota bacterium]